MDMQAAREKGSIRNNRIMGGAATMHRMKEMGQDWRSLASKIEEQQEKASSSSSDSAKLSSPHEDL